MSEASIVNCPACAKPVAIPAEYLGRIVHCVQCKATFTASDPPTLVRRTPSKISPFFFVPTFGLLLLGAAGVAANGYLYFAIANDPNVAKDYARGIVRELAETKPSDLPKSPKTEDEKSAVAETRKAFDAEQDRRIEASAEAMVPYMRSVQGPFALVSLGVFAGGLAFALRRWYVLAFVGCALAVANVNQACCIPGAVVGLWGFFALISEEGRRYFGRIP